MGKRFWTVMVVAAALVLLAVLACYVRIGATADAVAVLRTTGMSCGNCAGAITRALESLQGVAATRIDLDKGWVMVGYDTRSVGPERLAQQVRAAGFDSTVYRVLTPGQFREMTGYSMGGSAPDCCGKGLCGNISRK